MKGSEYNSHRLVDDNPIVCKEFFKMSQLVPAWESRGSNNPKFKIYFKMEWNENNLCEPLENILLVGTLAEISLHK